MDTCSFPSFHLFYWEDYGNAYHVKTFWEVDSDAFFVGLLHCGSSVSVPCRIVHGFFKA